MAEKATKKNEKDIDYRLFIVELDSHYEDFWLSERECKVCKHKYSVLRQRQLDPAANKEFCSQACSFQVKQLRVSSLPIDANGIHKPVIYRIFNKLTGKSYVGQTTQAFTLRWYQHFFNPSETKFHEAIKSANLPDWTFEVLETLESRIIKSDLDAREQFWISHFNSIENGYNSVKAA